MTMVWLVFGPPLTSPDTISPARAATANWSLILPRQPPGTEQSVAELACRCRRAAECAPRAALGRSARVTRSACRWGREWPLVCGLSGPATADVDLDAKRSRHQ